MVDLLHAQQRRDQYLRWSAVFVHVSNGLLEVIGFAMSPLAAIAALLDGVKLLGTQMTGFLHQKR